MSTGSLLVLPALKAIETAINSYLSLDSDSLPYQQSLVGNVVQVDVSGIGIELYFVFNQHRVEICTEFGAIADVVIRGAPLSLIAVASGRTGLMQSGVVIEGDVDTATRFSQLFDRVDIDWEEHVATIAGDNSAHLLGRFKASATDFLSRAQTSIQRNVADYLRDETRYLLHQWELDEFIDDVDDLRDRVDRLLHKAQVYKTRTKDDRQP